MLRAGCHGLGSEVSRTFSCAHVKPEVPEVPDPTGVTGAPPIMASAPRCCADSWSAARGSGELEGSVLGVIGLSGHRLPLDSSAHTRAIHSRWSQSSRGLPSPVCSVCPAWGGCTRPAAERPREWKAVAGPRGACTRPLGRAGVGQVPVPGLLCLSRAFHLGRAEERPPGRRRPGGIHEPTGSVPRGDQRATKVQNPVWRTPVEVTLLPQQDQLSAWRRLPGGCAGAGPCSRQGHGGSLTRMQLEGPRVFISATQSTGHGHRSRLQQDQWDRVRRVGAPSPVAGDSGSSPQEAPPRGAYCLCRG